MEAVWSPKKNLILLQYAGPDKNYYTQTTI